jgi:hypothetical protein
MSKAKFTPGPWVVEESELGHVIKMGNALEDDDQYDAQCEVHYDHECYFAEEISEYHPMNIQAKEAEANAYLMAAAPDMYEALELALLFITNGREQGHIKMPDAGSGDSAGETQSIILQALAEARRESTSSEAPELLEKPNGYH